MTEKKKNGGPTVETELKFEIDAKAVQQLRSAGWLKALQSGNATTRNLHATYYDTPDQALWRRGIAIRVRKEGPGFVQCVKTRGDGGVFSHNEWEMPVRTMAPSPEAILRDKDLRKLFHDSELESLEVAFETKIRRTSRRLSLADDSEASFDMDVGEVMTREASEPIHELEIELLSGNPRSIFMLGGKIAETAPVRFSTRTKAERGYALLLDEAATWHKMAAVTLKPGSTAEEALAATVARCIEHLTINEACVLARGHTEGVHQMRVATRRLRSALSIYKRYLPIEQFARLNGMLKQVINGLGPARDWDVFVDETFKPVRDYLADDPAIQVLHQAAEETRDAAYEQAQTTILSRHYGETLMEIGAWLHGRGWRAQELSEEAIKLFGPAEDVAVETLGKRHRKLVKAGKRIRKMTTEERHELRITVKKVRYAAEQFGSLYPAKRVKPYVKTLSGIQDSLGLLNDLAVCRGLLHTLSSEGDAARAAELWFASGIVVGWHTEVLAEHENDLFGLWDAFAATDPFWT